MKIKAEINRLDDPKYNIRYNLEKARLLIRRAMPHSTGLVHTYLGNISYQIEGLLESIDHYEISP